MRPELDHDVDGLLYTAPVPLTFPPPLPVDASQRATADVEVRYDDVAQDGRLKLSALSHAMGMVCWRGLLARHPMSQLGPREGIVPILSRLVASGGGGPISVFRELEAEGAWDMAVADDDARPPRILMLMTTDVFGRSGRTHGPRPEAAGERILVGRLYAEHVLTRPFGDPSKRKVERIPEGFGLPTLPVRHVPWIGAEALRSIPEGSTALETAPRDDEAELVFGLGHTDSNQHVNSLIYPRVFEEAALRRLVALGRAADGPLPTAMEVGFRKPCFAGDRARTSVQAFVDGETNGVTAALLSGEGDSLHASGRVYF